MGTLVLHVLLPEGSLPSANLVFVYAVATMAGVASHVPGGVGVFESVVIAALPASVPLDVAVIALLLFRLIYYLLPIMAGLATLSVIIVWTAAGRRSPDLAGFAPVVGAGRAGIPASISFLALSSGLFMMFAGLLPHPDATTDEIEALLRLVVLAGGPMVSSILGAFLVVLSAALFRRSRLAFWVVLVLLCVGMLTAASRAHDFDRVILLGFLLGVVLSFRREFDRTARIAQGMWSFQ